jgi:cytochrome d ubiquinol oxidase subunit II
MAIVSLWAPLAFDRIAARWFSLPNILFFRWVPAVTALVAFAVWRAIESGRDTLPFLATIALSLLGYLGPLISNFPYIVPPSLTIWQSAASPQLIFSC